MFGLLAGAALRFLQAAEAWGIQLLGHGAFTAQPPAHAVTAVDRLTSQPMAVVINDGTGFEQSGGGSIAEIVDRPSGRQMEVVHMPSECAAILTRLGPLRAP